jgi:uncharacterized protein
VTAVRLGIVSDTHDEIDRTARAVALLRAEGAEGLVHCGDLASPAVVELLAGPPSWFVFGNHDADMIPHLRDRARACGVTCLGWSGVVEFVGKRVAVVHGHLSGDVRAALAGRPDYLLSGHSHEPSDAAVGGVRRINPGALHRADRFTAAVLDVARDEVRFLEVA